MLKCFQLKKTGCMVKNLEVKTTCKNVLQPEHNSTCKNMLQPEHNCNARMCSSQSPISPLGVKTQPDPLYVPTVMHCCASPVPYSPLLVIKAPLPLFTVSATPVISLLPPKAATSG